MNRSSTLKIYRRDDGIVVHELWIDGVFQSSRLSPYPGDEVAAVTRIGPPLDPLAVRGEPLIPR